MQDRARIAVRDSAHHRADAGSARAAGGHRNCGRCRRVPAQRRAGAGGDHRLFHADRRRPVRFRPHRRHQRDLRRLRDGGPADPGAGAGRHAGQRASGPDNTADPGRRRGGLRGCGHPDCRWAQHRLGRTDLRPGRARTGPSATGQAQLRREPGRPRGTGQGPRRRHLFGRAEEGRAR